MRPLRQFNMLNLKGDERRWDELSEQLKSFHDILSKGIRFEDNFRGTMFTGVTFATANAEVQITHKLGYIPSGFISVRPSVAMSVYESGDTPWTTTAIYLKSNAVGNSSIFVF